MYTIEGLNGKYELIEQIYQECLPFSPTTVLIRGSPLQEGRVLEVDMADSNFSLAEDGGLIFDGGRVVYNYCVAFNSVSADGTVREEASIRRGKPFLLNGKATQNYRVAHLLEDRVRLTWNLHVSFLDPWEFGRGVWGVRQT